jgi:uncharacterized phage protein (TIGR01671 family)
MRDILFRGKRIDTGEWVEGYFFKWPCVSWKELSCVIVPVIGLEHGIAEQDIVDENTVGQWTGLTDKNGRKIFEGDVMEFDAYGFHYKGVVSFVDGNFYINCNCPDAFPFLDDAIKRHDAIYVGNIHDNKELIGGDDCA